ncbi:MAG: anti-sigma factor antagonist [Oscillospiraceae bacterium]|nr:anti-sigma factor antagonist [Oscillospiraceae bacterium]
MKTKQENNRLTIYLEGRIDTNNAAQTERELLDAAATAPGATVVLDAGELEYISSAGLRALMKLRKTVGTAITVENVSPEVYEIFEVTGFTELLDVRKRLREISVEGCEKLGQGGNGAVYRLDEDKIVKVYKPWMELSAIDRERSFAKTAFVNGIPSVIAYDVVKVGDCLGVVFELLKSDTLGHAMRDNPEKLEQYVDQYVELAKTLHSTHVPAGSFTRIQEVMHERADKLGKWCSAEEIALLNSIIDDIPEADTVTHNDLHPGNIMIQDGELVLIDMPEVTMGPPICDLTSIFRDMISAPQTQSNVIEGSVGMPADLILKVGNLFFMKYTGITDPAALGEYFKKLGLLYAFNVVLVPGSGSERAMQMGDMIMNNLLRPTVIPNEQAIRALFRTM